MENMIFTSKTFADCSLVLPKDATPLNFEEETFVNRHKTAKVFSLSSCCKVYTYWPTMTTDIPRLKG